MESGPKPNNQGAIRNAKGQYLPGVCGSGHQGGRPALPAEMKAFAQARSLEALQYVAKVLKDDAEPTKYRLMAADTLMDRGYGKPTTMIAGDPEGEAVRVELVELIKSAVKP